MTGKGESFMANISATILDDRSVLHVSGPEAAEFLQGLITNDIGQVKDGAAIHAGLLSPQGKILFEFIIAGHDDGYLIDCAGAEAPALVKRLTLYKLRSKVEIKDLSGALHVAALWPGAEAEAPGLFTDPRLAEMGQRLIGDEASLSQAMKTLSAEPCGPADYHARRIGLGIAEMCQDYPSGEIYPHEANFDRLGGVSFSKGCYVGQEVVSRMKHKTSIRKRIVPVMVSGDAPAMGAEIRADGKAAGQFGSSQDGRGLALLRLDRIEGAQEITAGTARLTPLKPGWADFEVPGAAS